jgi:long-chain acyl-CoA synthetase
MSKIAHTWEKSYPPGVVWSEPLPPPRAVEEILIDAAQKWPERTAIDFYDRVITFGELHRLAMQAAEGFQKFGIGPGVNVALHLPNTPHYVISVFGVLLAGGTVVSMSPLIAARDLKAQMEDVDAKILVTMMPPTDVVASTMILCRLTDFTTPDLARALAGAAPAAPPHAVPFTELIANSGNPVRHPHMDLREELAAIAFTGGTTGSPKGAMLTHANFSAVIAMRTRWLDAAGIDCNTKSLTILPVSHIYGFSLDMLMCIATGVGMVMHFKFDIRRVLEDISTKKIYFFAGVPTMYSVLMSHPRLTEYDLSSLKVCAVGGAPISPEAAARFKKLTGLTLLNGYGLTEMAPIVTMQRFDTPRHGAVGLPSPATTITIVDLEDRTRVLGPGEIGEICCAGPQMMKGYWKRPSETAVAIHDGRLCTGDIGYLDDDGYLFILDRKKDMVFVGGHNVFPGKVDKVIGEHPLVDEVAVVGVPDSYFGYRLKAFVTLRDGTQTLTLRNLEDFLHGKLAAYEIPTEMDVRTSLPKTAVGKISKQDLLAESETSKQAT